MSQYHNPPIAEAICEFRFSQETKWDLTIPGLVYDKIKTEFPIKESKVDQQIEIKTDDKGGIQQNLKNSGSKAIFLAENRLSLIQVGQNLLSVNLLKPYPGWTAFRPKIRLAYDVINTVTEIKGIDRMALVYIDKIEIPGTTIEMEEYFKFYPHLSKDLPQTHSSFFVGCDFPYKNERDICKLQLSPALADKKNHIAFLMMTEYFLVKKNAIPPERALEWMDEAHTIVRDLFRGAITEKLENIFGRVE
jgi:uncharacterized protein (TIGR04255 family)